MARIEFEQISDNEVEVIIPPETPMEMVQKLTKGFASRGLVEDLKKSTLSVRYFYRPEDNANDLADKLIKSLQNLSKDELPYWHPKSQMANQTRVRDMEIGERRAKLGVKQPTNVATTPEPNITPDAPAIKPPSGAAPSVNTSAGKMYDNTPAAMNTAGGSGKRYAYINDKVSQSEHPEDCDCARCQEMEKSGYGPKGSSQYNATDNARRKANNTTGSVDIGPNTNVKAFSTKPGQMSGKESANLTARIQAKANKKQPVKTYSAEERDALASQMGLKKSWGQHFPFPNAEDEMAKIAHARQAAYGDDAAASQLAAMMNSKAMLNPNHRQPSAEDMLMAGEIMGLGTSEEVAKSADKQWHGTFNNWLQEASKPISQRFSSEEEEIAYWNSIKVNGSRDDGDPGY